ncbi:MAG: hypothetical protein ABSD74_00750 [Rhizomicrobium sp.]
MRFAVLAGIAALNFISPAYAVTSDPVRLPTGTTPFVSDEKVVLNVAPGDQIAIACGPLEDRAPDSDVRVVLTISAVPGESAPGYKKVLATDAQLLKDAVRVRIPSVPDIQDHTVDLNVYVVSDKGSQQCNAGQMKIF